MQMITPYSIYFTCIAIFGLCVAFWPERTLGQLNKDRLQDHLDRLVMTHGSGFGILIFSLALAVACIAWPLMVVERVVDLVSTKSKK